MEQLKRILHVEDDESIRLITEVTLQTVGNLEVIGCESGREALERFGGFQPQVLLLDVMMPEMDGPSTLTAMEERFDLGGIMVLFMTAKVHQSEIDHLKSIGGFDVILKPFDPMTLCDQVESCWRQFHAQRQE